MHTLASAPALLSAQQRERPNMVFVLSDDHSAPYLGCYGDPAVRTPNIDKFASEGLRFDRAFTAAPQCVPSRTAFLTGRSPVAARMGRFSSPLPPDVITLPELLRPTGYHTGILGRVFHLDGPGQNVGVLSDIIQKHNLKTFRKRVDYLDPGSGRPQRKDKLNEFFNSVPANKPFFLWANFSDPHHVWDAPPADPAKLRYPAHLPDLPGMREDLAKYCGEITRLDEEFQWVIDALTERKVLDNTLIVFMGDNGQALPHGKGSLYDPGLNVPLIARWPGHIRPGATAELISGEDITPTFLEAAGVAPRKEMSGRSFFPLLTGGSYTVREHVFAARLHHGNGPYTRETKANGFDLSRCVRSKNYKLIYNCTPHQEYAPVDSARDAGWTGIVAAHKAGLLKPEHERAYFTRPRPVIELYDLQADPSELNNLAGKPELKAVEQELKVALADKMVTDYDFLPPPV